MLEKTMVSVGLGTGQFNPAAFTKGLTIVAALAVSATALCLILGAAKKRRIKEDKDILEENPQGFTSDQFRDNIAMTTEKLGNIFECDHANDHFEGRRLNLYIEEEQVPEDRSRGTFASHPNDPSSSSRASAENATSCGPRGCVASRSCRSVGVSTDPCCSSSPWFTKSLSLCSSNESSPKSIGFIRDSIHGDVVRPHNLDKSEESRVSWENIPPPACDYLEMLSTAPISRATPSGTRTSRFQPSFAVFGSWRPSTSATPDSGATITCWPKFSEEAKEKGVCETCMDECCEICIGGQCEECLPDTSLPGAHLEEQNDGDGNQVTGQCRPGVYCLQQAQHKKKVRFTPNTVEPTGDNQDYRRRPKSMYYPPDQRPLTSYANVRPRLLSQAAKNTITGTRETVRNTRFHYL